jgi:hypothetical protein
MAPLTSSWHLVGWDPDGAAIQFCTVSGGPVVVKRFAPAVRSEMDLSALEDLIDWPTRQLQPAQQAELRRFTCWPTSIILHAGEQVGIVMPVAPHSMFKTTDKGRRPRHIEHLAHDAYVSPNEFWEPPARLAALGRLILTFDWLHQHGVTVGDCHEGNILVDVAGKAICLIDCDSMAGPWGMVNRPVAPADYQELLGPKPSIDEDFSRLALLALKVMQERLAARDADRELLLRCMHTDAVDLLENTVARRRADVSAGNEPVLGAPERMAWRDLGLLWTTFVDGDHLMFKPDGKLIRPWTDAESKGWRVISERRGMEAVGHVPDDTPEPEPTFLKPTPPAPVTVAAARRKLQKRQKAAVPKPDPPEPTKKPDVQLDRLLEILGDPKPEKARAWKPDPPPVGRTNDKPKRRPDSGWSPPPDRKVVPARPRRRPASYVMAMVAIVIAATYVVLSEVRSIFELFVVVVVVAGMISVLGQM